MSVAYDDTQPKNNTNSSLGFTVERVNVSNGDLASYTFTLTNKNDTNGLGLIVVVFRPPSCYQLNFDLFE